MNKVYLVVGSTGLGSDYTEWNVAAYIDEDVAKQHVDLLNKWLMDQQYHVDQEYTQIYGWNKGSNPYDPHCEVFGQGTSYSYAEVPLFLHPDELIEAMERGEL